MKLEDKISLVTGAAQGIGRSIAISLAEKGSIVFINDVNEKIAQETYLYIKNQGYSCHIALFDVSDFKAVQEMFELIYSKERRLDILVNNAGIVRDATLLKMSEKDWDDVIAVNLKSVFNCCKLALPKMVENGAKVAEIGRNWLLFGQPRPKSLQKGTKCLKIMQNGAERR